tara:strand:+ start:208 stop:465 length:258 start_codon:yes stop_codon:yes gene_type:complete
MDLLQVIKNHEKDFMKWFYDGEDFSDKLEEALVEAFKDQIPYTVLTGETSDTSEWLNDKLSFSISLNEDTGKIVGLCLEIKKEEE